MIPGILHRDGRCRTHVLLQDAQSSAVCVAASVKTQAC